MRQAATLFISLLLGNTSFAQQQSLLWQISGNGLAKPSYLYGTIHLICEADMQMSEALKQKFAQSEKLFLEMDMSDHNTIAKAQQLSMLPEHKTLRSFFKNDAEYARVDNFFSNTAGVPLSFLAKMKPFALVSILYAKCLPCMLPASYELSFIEMAKAQQKQIVGLETVEEQMAVVDKMTDAAQRKMLLSMVDSFETAKQSTHQLVQLYKQQKLDSLYTVAINNPDMIFSKNFFLDDRNKKWIPRLEKAIHNNSCFIAIGAAHLAANLGVINLLRQKGYTIEPL